MNLLPQPISPGRVASVLLAGALLGGGGPIIAADTTLNPVRLITLDPGHFHAALFHKDMLPDVAGQVHVYAPLGPDLLAHLNRVAQFNLRPANPTQWKVEVHAGPDFLERMLAERPGNVVVLSGNNQGKIARIAACVRNDLHVLADKPWIIDSEDLPQLAAALDDAGQKGIVAYDAMTQRFEITCLLQRELVNDRELFGACLPGTPQQPAVYMESVHFLLKEVAGAPLQRPPWFFDPRQQGECLADVGPHLVDLVQWTLFPDQALDYRRDIRMRRATRRPLILSRAQFQRVTGQSDFPASLRNSCRNDCLEYFADDRVNYTLRGIHVQLDARWEYEAPPGGKDTELAIFRGSVSSIEVRQGKAEQFVPEVYVVPNRPGQAATVRAALGRKVESLCKTYPGLEIQEQAGQFRVVIPERYRVGHEAHFALLTQRFLDYVRHPRSVPAWEKPNMLAKYFVTTQGIKLACQAGHLPTPGQSLHKDQPVGPR